MIGISEIQKQYELLMNMKKKLKGFALIDFSMKAEKQRLQLNTVKSLELVFSISIKSVNSEPIATHITDLNKASLMACLLFIDSEIDKNKIESGSDFVRRIDSILR